MLENILEQNLAPIFAEALRIPEWPSSGTILLFLNIFILYFVDDSNCFILILNNDLLYLLLVSKGNFSFLIF